LRLCFLGPNRTGPGSPTPKPGPTRTVTQSNVIKVVEHDHFNRDQDNRAK
jgi:hypothetical protein